MSVLCCAVLSLVVVYMVGVCGNGNGNGNAGMLGRTWVVWLILCMNESMNDWSMDTSIQTLARLIIHLTPFYPILSHPIHSLPITPNPVNGLKA